MICPIACIYNNYQIPEMQHDFKKCLTPKMGEFTMSLRLIWHFNDLKKDNERIK